MEMMKIVDWLVVADPESCLDAEWLLLEAALPLQAEPRQEGQEEESRCQQKHSGTCNPRRGGEERRCQKFSLQNADQNFCTKSNWPKKREGEKKNMKRI